MIDRNSRRALREQLRHLAAGLVTNDAYEDSVPQHSPDRAIRQIHLEGAWYLYDDLRTHRLVGRDALDRQAKREVARWVLFLGTDLEYEWPVLSAPLRFAGALLSIVTLGLFGWVSRKLAGQDAALWPFRRQSDYEAALRQHPFCIRA